MTTTNSLLDEKYDFALLGTSLPLSILSAALSRAGFSVLHIDDAEYYGGPWASLTLKELIGLKKDGKNGLIDFHYEFSSALSSSEDGKIPAELEAVNRHFAISLAPTLLPCSGSTIDVLVRSKVASYCTFRLLQKTAIYSNSKDGWPLKTVPSSKEDIFKDKTLSLADKRRLMKLLQKAAPKQQSTSSSSSETNEVSDESKEVEQIQGNFFDYLTKSENGPKFTTSLANDVMYGVALSSSSKELASMAMKRIERHIVSVGRYGNSAYLIGQYGGAGEMAQCFSRASAVQGGTFVLGHKVRQLDFIGKQDDVVQQKDEEEAVDKWTIALEGIEGSCQAGCVVGDQDILHRMGRFPSFEDTQNEKTTTQRQAMGIMLLDRGMRIESADQNSDSTPPETALVIFPPNEEDSGSIWALQMGEGTFSCPKGTYLVYLCTALPRSANTLNSAEQARKALSSAREGVLRLAKESEAEWENTKQSTSFEPLFECYMVRESQQRSAISLDKDALISVPSSVDNLVTSLDDATQQAEDLFWKLCGGQDDGIGRERAEILRKRQRRTAASSYPVGRGLAGIPQGDVSSKEELAIDFFPISEDNDGE